MFFFLSDYLTQSQILIDNIMTPFEKSFLNLQNHIVNNNLLHIYGYLLIGASSRRCSSKDLDELVLLMQSS